MARQDRELSPVMSWQELSQYRNSLQRLDDERVKELYREKLRGCEMKTRELPNARCIQELVQVCGESSCAANRSRNIHGEWAETEKCRCGRRQPLGHRNAADTHEAEAAHGMGQQEGGDLRALEEV